MKTFPFLFALCLWICPMDSSAQNSLRLSEVTWQKVSDIGAKCIERNTEGRIFAGSWGVLRSDDYGESWSLAKLPGIYSETNSISIGRGDTLYASTAAEDKLFRSINKGVSWHEIVPDSVYLEIICTAINSKKKVFVGTEYGLYYLRSDDKALVPTNWKGSVYRIAVNENDALFIDSWGVQRSLDDGETWERITTGLSNTGLNAITFNAQGHIYAGGASPDGGVFKSINNGDLWEKTLYSFQEESDSVVSAICCMPDGNVLIGTLGTGALLLDNKDQTLASIWQSDSEYDEFVTAFHLTPDGHVLLGTTNGIYRSDQVFSVTSVNAEKTLNGFLWQNSPNPVRQQTRISYSLLKQSQVKLTIINVAGQTIDMLVDMQQPVGKYSVIWNVKKADPGIYFYLLQTESGKDCKKMLLLGGEL